MDNSQPPAFNGRTERFLERPLPSSEESERAILGGILLNNDHFDQCNGVLFPEDFYSPLHRRVYVAMQRLNESSQKIDPIFLGEELKKDGSIESIGGIAAITNLTYGLPHFANITEYITLVREKSYSRRLINVCSQITSEALEEELDKEQLTQFAETKIHALADGQNQSDFMSVEEGFAESIDLSRQRAEADTVIIGEATGFTDLDVKLKGLRKGASIIIAARPSIGKTTLALNIATRVAVDADKMVAVFCMEMDAEELYSKILISEANVDGERYSIGHLTDEEWERVEATQQAMRGKKLFIDDTPYITVSQMRSKLRRLEHQHRTQVGLIVVDYLQLMGGGDREQRQVEVAAISRQLKQMAREFECPGVYLSQLNRAAEARANHRPTMADLRESGAIEQDADVVAFIYREDFYNPDPQYHTNRAEIIIAKNRKGPTGVSHLMFDGPKSTFRNLALESQQAYAEGGDF